MKSKYLDGLIGYVIGDALGFPLQNQKRDDLLKKPLTKMIESDHFETPEGTWSTNTSLTIATIDSINAKCAIDFKDIMNKISAFNYHCSYTPFNEVLDIDVITLRAIEKYNEDKENVSSWGIENKINNKSLARILPIAYYAIEKKLKDLEVLDLVKSISSLTHSNEICQMGCYIYVRLVMFLLNGKDKFSAYSMTKCVDYSMFSEEAQNTYARLIKDDISKYKLSEIESTSEPSNTLEVCIWLMLKSDSYKDSLIGAINLGEDTSTNAALTGALTGIIYGYETFPEDWLNKIIKKEYLLDIFEEFSENKY